MGHHHFRVVWAKAPLGRWDGHHEAPALIVTVHLLGAMLVSLLTAQTRVLEPRLAAAPSLADSAYAGVCRLAGLVCCVCAVQMAAGAWVSTNYACTCLRSVPHNARTVGGRPWTSKRPLPCGGPLG